MIPGIMMLIGMILELLLKLLLVLLLGMLSLGKKKSYATDSIFAGSTALGNDAANAGNIYYDGWNDYARLEVFD